MKKQKTKKVKVKDKILSRIKAKRIFLMFVSICIVLLSAGLFLLYGPWSYIRETLITTAMTTMSHQYLAKWFYDEETIQEVLNNQKVIEPEEDTDPDQIEVKDQNEVVCKDE